MKLIQHYIIPSNLNITMKLRKVVSLLCRYHLLLHHFVEHRLDELVSRRESEVFKA
jgi:hypothetical protein